MNERVLLVDDEEGIRKVLGIALGDMGYTVFTARDGREALEIFRKETPEIVLTDIKMPGMDGIRLLEAIKRKSPDTEVIMITGHGDMDLAVKSLKHEATDFVTKPINDDALEIALRRAHEKISMRNQLRAYTENLENLVAEKSARVVELERQVAVNQAVEGFTEAIRGIAEDLDPRPEGVAYFNEMPCFVSVHNRDLKVIATNPLYVQRLGNRVGENSWEIYADKGGGARDCPVKRTFASGMGHRSRETVHTVSGKTMPVIVHTAPIRNREKQVELVVEIAADVGEIERLQEELRTTRQRYQQLFDEVPCYISVQDRNLRVVETNRRFKEDFGTALGAYCYEIYKHREDPCADCPVVKTFEDGNAHQSEMVVTSMTGDLYNVLIWTAPIRNGNGEVVQVMELLTNITQIRQLQDHLSSLGLLIGSISHGIKGLLTGLDGGMYLVSSGFAKENAAQIQEGWETVKLMVERIRSMVLNILYYAKQRDLNWEKVDVLRFAQEVALTVEPKMAVHHIRFVKSFDPGAGQFEVDAGVVHSALINILENAVDACLADPKIKPHEVRFAVKAGKDDILFDVTDNGIGMDPETRDNLFTLFFSTKGKSGTGLGLFVSNKIIEQHGGHIRVESMPEKGSSFRIRIPKTLPPAAKTPDPPVEA